KTAVRRSPPSDAWISYTGVGLRVIGPRPTGAWFVLNWRFTNWRIEVRANGETDPRSGCTSRGKRVAAAETPRTTIHALRRWNRSGPVGRPERTHRRRWDS